MLAFQEWNSSSLNKPMQKASSLQGAFLAIMLCCGLLFSLHVILPCDVYAQNHLTVLFSGNVNGETESCG
jgi:hypothetical protein